MKTKTPPLCRYCGREIAKWTETRFIVTDPESMKYSRDSKTLVDKLPQTKQEAQKLFNEQITSVKRCRKYDNDSDAAKDVGIDQVRLWDGERYQDEFFCNGDHARRFAYLLAREGRCTDKYNTAIKKQAAK